MSLQASHERLVQAICSSIRERWRRQQEGKSVGIVQRARTSAPSKQSRTVTVEPGDAQPWVVEGFEKLNRVLHVNEATMSVSAEPGVTMQDLFLHCVPHGLIPQVVIEFPGITLGGAIQGAALESSSFRFGQFNDTLLDMDVILGDGSLVRAEPTGDHARVFYGVSGTYGSIALITRVTVALERAAPFVQLQYTLFSSAKAGIAHMGSVARETLQRSANKESTTVHYMEGIVHDKTTTMVITGYRCDAHETRATPKQTLRNHSDPWFHRHSREIAQESRSQSQVPPDGVVVRTELMPLEDYIFRWDHGCYWMGEHVIRKIPGGYNKVSRTLFGPFLTTDAIYKLFHTRDKDIWFSKYIAADCYVPLPSAHIMVAHVHDHWGFDPIWLCPMLGTTKPQHIAPHFLTDRAKRGGNQFFVNVGMYGRPTLIPVPFDRIEENLHVESVARQLAGRFMLYGPVYSKEELFWEEYDLNTYEENRKALLADCVFDSLFDKVRYRPSSKQDQQQARERRRWWRMFAGAFIAFIGAVTYVLVTNS